jgi:TRAP-type uncharacterized transport system substrate-binding protein
LTRGAAIKEFLRTNWHLVTIGATAAAILGLAILLLANMPPRAIVMATGPEGGTYHEAGKRYQAALARDGVHVRLVVTAGALENLALLRDPHSSVDVAFLQSGSVNEDEAPELESLGTLFYEPLWVFYRRGLAGITADYRSGLPGITADGLRGRTVSIGPEGSGTRALSLELLKRNGIDDVVLLGLSPEEAGEKLLAGGIDAAFIVTSWEAPVVQRLIVDERVELMGFLRADAYVALYPYLSRVVLPAGVGDLGKRRPPADVILFAPKASLVVRKDLHSAIQYLLLGAAMRIHSRAGIFQRPGRFPAAESTDLPLSSQALSFYKSGPPFLDHYLPFWMASLVGRLLVLLIPILAVLYPLARFLPALYDWLMRAKISRLYGELRFLEDEIGTNGRNVDSSTMLARLEKLEKQANQLKIPITYGSMMYLLRSQITLVRERLKAM